MEERIIENIKTIYCNYEPLDSERKNIVNDIKEFKNFCTLKKADDTHEDMIIKNIYITQELSLGRFESRTGWGVISPFSSGQTIFTFKTPQKCKLTYNALYCEGDG